MEEKVQIKVCECGAPLHWTFLFAGAEYFCMNCGANSGMLGAGKNVDRTTERVARQKVATDVFKALRKHLIGSGGYTKSNCKKCKEGKDRYHTYHLTEMEKVRDKTAKKILNSLKGKLAPKNK